MNNATERVRAYLDELGTRNTLDPEIIQNLRPEVLGEISLRVSDLHAILAALEAVEALAKMWQKTPKRPDLVDAALHHASIKLRAAISEALA